jgi:ornithine cyclodeaminase/alanine dehydrogenase-like protein (mu-crystallin family)
MSALLVLSAAAAAGACRIIVTCTTAQAAAIGDLHHAIAAGVMTADDVHAELGEVVAGRKRGRAGDEEITVFDSTGTGLQDVAAAIAAYRSYTLTAKEAA